MDIEGASHNTFEIQDGLICKGVGNFLAFGMRKMLQSKQTDAPTGRNFIQFKVVQKVEHYDR